MAILKTIQQLIVAAGLLMSCAAAAAAAAGEVMILCYHEIESDGSATVSRTAIRASELAAQFAWLRAAGYTPVSLQQLLDSRQGRAALPEKAVLLSFDDGRRDFYTRVFPLLKLFRYPALLALVGRWLEVAKEGVVDYDGTPLARSQFVEWEEIREMQRSGLVEIVSHGYDLHRGVLANPQGNTQPAATSRVYYEGQYETDAMYLKRLRGDLRASRDLLLRHTGVAPRAIAWPYGRSNRAVQELAAELGMPVGLTLVDGLNTPQTPLATLKRHLVENGTSLQAYAEALRDVWSPDPARSVRIDPARWQDSEEGLSRILDRIRRLSTNVTFVDPRAIRGEPEVVLFPTSRRAVKADELNRIAWQIERRAGGAVFVDLPLAWLADSALLDDLARQVKFSGVRVPVMPGHESMARVLAVMERWCWPIRVAYAPAAAPPADAWDKLRTGDLVVLPATAEMFASVGASHARRVLFEFDPLTMPAARIAGDMRRLEADGFRQFGIASLPDAGFEVVWPALSLRSYPLLP